jgi:predicted transcriptional regulator
MLAFVTRDFIFSVKPKYAERIMDGTKTVELRRRFGNDDAVGAHAFIYASSPAKEMVGFAVIEDVRKLPLSQIWELYGPQACITRREFDDYFSGVDEGYAIVLKRAQRLKIATTIHELRKRFGFSAPQSYRYASAEYHALIS